MIILPLENTLYYLTFMSTNQILKKMKNLSLKLSKTYNYTFFILICLSSFFVSSQEIIVDLNPDVVITASSSDFSIDIDNDATVDFLFRVQVMSGDTVLGGQPSTFDGASAIVESLNGQPAGETANGAFTLTNFSEGESVSGSNEFGMDTSYSLGISLLIDAGIGIFPYLYGSFLDVSNQFLGVRFTSGTDTHYGWVELSVSAGADTIIIHSYGYDETPDQMIDVGGLGGVSALSESDVKVWNGLESLSIAITADYLGDKFSIVSLEGQELHTGILNKLENKVMTAGIPSGIYTIMIDCAHGRLSKRIYIH